MNKIHFDYQAMKSNHLNMYHNRLLKIIFVISFLGTLSGCTTSNPDYRQDVLWQTNRLLNMSFDSCGKSPYSFKNHIFCERIHRFASQKNYDYYKIDSIFTEIDVYNNKLKALSETKKQSSSKPMQFGLQPRCYVIVRWYKNNLPTNERLNFLFCFEPVVRSYVVFGIQNGEQFYTPVPVDIEEE